VLAEVSVTLLVLALAVVALVPVFALNIRAGKSSSQAQEASFLSQEMLDQIRLRKWDENTPTPTAFTVGSAALGPDAGENAADKRQFDDMDDFHGWTESPATDPLMRAIPGLPGFTRSVTVQYVTSNLVVSTAAATDYKLVTVCTQVPRRNDTCLNTLVTNR
jgi:Tfp pilus assembly protein PilV